MSFLSWRLGLKRLASRATWPPPTPVCRDPYLRIATICSSENLDLTLLQIRQAVFQLVAGSAEGGGVKCTVLPSSIT